MEELKIKLLKFKYLTSIICILLFSLLAIFLPFFEYIRNKEFRLISVPLTIFGFWIFWIFLKFLKIWKHRNEIIKIVDGNIINNTALLSGAKKINISNISSVSMSDYGLIRTSQLMFFLKPNSKSYLETKKNNIFKDQLSGKTVYLTSYFIGIKQLRLLFKHVNLIIK